MRTDLIKKSLENQKTVAKALATAKKGMTLTQTAEIAKLPVTTVKRHLEKLISTGRVHVDCYRGFNVYRLIGKGRKSKCCGAPVYASGEGDTHYYVCTKCGNACDAKM